MNNIISTDSFSTPLGWLAYAISSKGLLHTTFMHPTKESAMEHLIENIDQETKPISAEDSKYWRGVLTDSLEGKRVENVSIDESDWSPFFKKVYDFVRQIPAGEVMSYGEVAEKIGTPGAARAVGLAMKKNPIAPIVPCHRVVSKSGSIGGFSAAGGVELKEKMLEKESALIV